MSQTLSCDRFLHVSSTYPGMEIAQPHMAWPHDLRKRAEIRSDRQGEVIPGIEARHIPGFLAIDLMHRELPEGGSEFATLMRFDRLESVRAFMGDDSARSHVPAAARAVLSSFDERAEHYEVIDRRDQR
jgi:heme-degrading monooxygenase HmoA